MGLPIELGHSTRSGDIARPEQSGSVNGARIPTCKQGEYVKQQQKIPHLEIEGGCDNVSLWVNGVTSE